MKRTLVSLLMLSPLALSGCGGSSGSSGEGPFFFNGSQQQGGPNNSAPVTSLRGRVVLQAVALTEAGERAELAQYRTQLQGDGLTVSSNGQFVAWPQAPASGWTAELGAQTVLLDVDGSFAFESVPDGATEIILRHPSDPSISYSVTLARLAELAGRPILLLSVFKGSCGMDGRDTDDFCAPDLPPPLPKNELRPRVEVDESTLRPGRLPFHERRRMVMGPLGSEPDPNIARDRSDLVRRCPDTDGIYQVVNLPVVGHQAKYLQSTCHMFVRTNACLNENNLSDLEALLSAAPTALELQEVLRADAVQTDFFLPRVTGARNFILHCYQNHRHRHCGQINIGDIVAKLPDGTIVKPTTGSLALNELLRNIGLNLPGFATVEVQAGAPVLFTIHNNGAFGTTKIRKIKTDLQGTLSGDGIPVRPGLQEIRHFNPISYEPPQDNEGDQDADQYVADRQIRFTPPANLQPGQEDSYVFLVDDRYLVITFKAVPARPFLRRLGSAAEVQVQDLNSAGTITTLRQDKTYLEPVNQEPVELIAEPAGALLNDDGLCLYQATNHASHAKLRFVDGQEVELEPPAGSLSTFADGIVALSPQGFYFCKAKRVDGKNDFYTEVQGQRGKAFLNAPEGLAPSTEVTPLTSTTRDALWANASGGSVTEGPFAGFQNAGKLSRYDFATRTWSSTLIPPRADFLPGQSVRYVDATSNSLLTYTSGLNFSPARPPADVTWLNFFTFLIQSGAPFVREQESKIEGSGARTVANTTDPVPAEGQPASTHGVVGMNEAGEVAGFFRDQSGNKAVIFPVSGPPKDIVPLLPAGAPAGSWSPLKMAGRYLILQHQGAEESDIYLWFRGTQD